MKMNSGLSLIEVMVAIMLLAIGVIAAAGLQGTALSASSEAERIQNVTKVAESELNYYRQITLTHAVNEENGCGVNSDDAYSCTVTVIPCDVQDGGFVCSEDETADKAYEVTVSIDGPGDADASLTTYVAQSSYRTALSLTTDGEE